MQKAGVSTFLGNFLGQVHFPWRLWPQQIERKTCDFGKCEKVCWWGKIRQLSRYTREFLEGKCFRALFNRRIRIRCQNSILNGRCTCLNKSLGWWNSIDHPCLRTVLATYTASGEFEIVHWYPVYGFGVACVPSNCLRVRLRGELAILQSFVLQLHYLFSSVFLSVCVFEEGELMAWWLIISAFLNVS